SSSKSAVAPAARPSAHPVQQFRHGHVAEPGAALAAGEQVRVALLARPCLQDFNCSFAEGNAARLVAVNLCPETLRRDRPYAAIEVDFIQPRADDGAGARGREHKKFQGSCTYAGARPQVRHEPRDFAVGRAGWMLDRADLATRG